MTNQEFLKIYYANPVLRKILSLSHLAVPRLLTDDRLSEFTTVDLYRYFRELELAGFCKCPEVGETVIVWAVSMITLQYKFGKAMPMTVGEGGFANFSCDGDFKVSVTNGVATIVIDDCGGLDPNPVHTHDCFDCLFLGHYKNTTDTYDLYYCAKEPTLIARYGSEGCDYTSGMIADTPALYEARRLAKVRGYIE